MYTRLKRQLKWFWHPHLQYAFHQTVKSVLRYVQKNSHCTNAEWRVKHAPRFGLFDIESNFSQCTCAAKRSSQWLKKKTSAMAKRKKKKAKSALLHLDTLCVRPSPVRAEHFENRPGNEYTTTCTHTHTHIHTYTHTHTWIPAIWAKTRGKVNLWIRSRACRHCCSRRAGKSPWVRLLF